MKYKIGILFSKKDFKYNLDNYGKNYNLLFVTGMVGAGKSTISKEIASKKGAIILSQDWLSWSEVYKDDKLANEILKEFYKKCPVAKEAAEKNWWHKNMMTKLERDSIRKQYNKFLIEYTSKKVDKLYIIEGIDIYRVISPHELINRGIIIKGTSALKCFFRRYKRDKTLDNQKNLKSKIAYIRMVINESKIYYFKDRKKLNDVINKILNP